MPEIHQQNPDGSWSPASPMGWQPGVGGVPGLDWEVSRPGRRWRAELIWKTTLMAVVHSRWRPVLLLRMALVQPAVVTAVRLGPPDATVREAVPADA